MKYSCPMHPEIKSDSPGTCPKCGMELILEGEVRESPVESSDYLPLIIVIASIFIIALILLLVSGNVSLKGYLQYFMASFFTIFAGFKLVDLKRFAEGYSMYDLLAMRFYPYGYIFPFIELFFGLAMLFTLSNFLLIAEIIVMAFSGAGVAVKLAKREKFQCVCLGTTLKVPLTYVTLTENFGMAALALLMLISS